MVVVYWSFLIANEKIISIRELGDLTIYMLHKLAAQETSEVRWLKQYSVYLWFAVDEKCVTQEFVKQTYVWGHSHTTSL